ncbi:MAG: glycoside hydrolase family 3 C-terminal domain-containing protein [Candidatus Enteromonas sp.]|nr:glycoside hydrolase family 3 C-terminal domain-containing protein [Candidatus Enteromonas sp.]
MKPRMKPGKFTAIFGPLSAVALAVAIAVNPIADSFDVTLNNLGGGLGQGELVVNQIKGSENWDTNYVNATLTTAEATRAHGAEVTTKLAQEGIVLLKNKNNTLPLAKTEAIAPMGYYYAHPVYGGTGSGNVNTSADYVYSPKKALNEVFGAANVDATIGAVAENADNIHNVSEAEGTMAASRGGGMFSADDVMHGINIDAYTAVQDNLTGKNAIIFIGRSGGESFDLKTDGYADGSKHKLVLSKDEKDLIALAKAKAKSVTVVINSSNAMELGILESGDYEVDAILLAGGPGATGFKALAQILAGDVNPSGRTADIFPADFTLDPTFANFGDYSYTNASYTFNGNPGNAHFVEYEEGIYVGYKYYETAHDIGATGFNYDNAVVYPFGYGLSYTTFSQTLDSLTLNGDVVTATVTVKNTGTVKGKEVVQLYYNAPYTQKDKDKKIEKATKNLVEFAKTKELAPNESQTLTVTFDRDDMASYDSTGAGSYFLEGGEYTVYLAKNSHESWGSKKINIANDISFDGSNNEHVRKSERDGQAELNTDGTYKDHPDTYNRDGNRNFRAAKNQFSEATEYMAESGISNLTRADNFATKPTAPAATKEMAAKYLANFNLLAAGHFDVKTNELLGNATESLVYNDEKLEVKKNGLVASNFRGKSYYDPMWEDLLDQIDWEDATTQEELRDLFFYAAYNTAALSAIGKNGTKDYDGPQGFSSFMDNGLVACAYCSEVMIAQTFNKELVKEMGDAIGQEALTNPSGRISGWYGPAMNTHRSPFSGRNFEYYSEDGVLAGKIAAAVVSGAADRGLYAYMKHFAMNDMETNRMNHLCTWATEQTIRETYLKSFELCVKESRGTLYYTDVETGEKVSRVVRGTTGVMSSFNAIGTTMCSNNYNLLNNVLRSEWGFEGLVETDFGPYVDHDAMLRAGNDLLLNANWGGAKTPWNEVFKDTTSNTFKHAARTAVHNVAYTYVNSNAMQGVAPGSTSYYKMAGWKKLTIGLAIGFGVLAACGATFICLKWLDWKKHPEHFVKEEA